VRHVHLALAIGAILRLEFVERVHEVGELLGVPLDEAPELLRIPAIELDERAATKPR
jgi:hypothetical protein